METVSTFTIDSARLWNNTGFRIEAGGQYKFTATGTWVDGGIPCGPSGYRSPNLLFELAGFFRRYPRARWFELIGAFDADITSAFRIGSGKVLSASQSGVLTCFANDIGILYGNNAGSIQLAVQRLR